MQYIRPSVSIARGYRPVSRSRKDYPKPKHKSNSILQINKELKCNLELVLKDHNYLKEIVDLLTIAVLRKPVSSLGSQDNIETFIDALEEIRVEHRTLKHRYRLLKIVLITYAILQVLIVGYMYFGG